MAITFASVIKKTQQKKDGDSVVCAGAVFLTATVTSSWVADADLTSVALPVGVIVALIVLLVAGIRVLAYIGKTVGRWRLLTKNKKNLQKHSYQHEIENINLIAEEKMQENVMQKDSKPSEKLSLKYIVVVVVAICILILGDLYVLNDRYIKESHGRYFDKWERKIILVGETEYVM